MIDRQFPSGCRPGDRGEGPHGAAPKLGDIVLRTGREVNGLVTDLAGEPVASALVMPAEFDRPRRARAAPSGADGRFTLAGLAEIELRGP